MDSIRTPARGLVVGLIIICLGLGTVLGFVTIDSHRAHARLRSAESDAEQARVQSDRVVADRVQTLEKLLREQSEAYAELQNRYSDEQRTNTTEQPATTAAAPAETNALAAAGSSGDRGGQWLERLRTEDPERYKQMQEAREQRRQQVSEYFDSQLDRLDQRYQAAGSQDEADLVAEISTTLGKLDELRQRWQEVRQLPEEERRAQARELGRESHQTWQKLVELRTRDRELQLKQFAAQIGYADPSTSGQIVDQLQQIYRETETNPMQFMGMGRGGWRNEEPRPATTQ